MTRSIKFLLSLSLFIYLSDYLLIGKISFRLLFNILLSFRNCLGANGEPTTADIVNDHLEKGKKLLATGQLSDAISHFHSAIGRRRKLN